MGGRDLSRDQKRRRKLKRVVAKQAQRNAKHADVLSIFQDLMRFKNVMIEIPPDEGLAQAILCNVRRVNEARRQQGFAADLVEGADLVGVCDELMAQLLADPATPKSPAPPWRWQAFDWRDKQASLKGLLSAGVTNYLFRFGWERDCRDDMVGMLDAFKEFVAKAGAQRFSDYLDQEVEFSPFEVDSDEGVDEEDESAPSSGGGRQHPVERVL